MLIVYVPVVLLATRVVDWQQQHLVIAIVVGTAFVKLGLLYLYPLAIAPIFRKKSPFP